MDSHGCEKPRYLPRYWCTAWRQSCRHQATLADVGKLGKLVGYQWWRLWGVKL